MGPQGPGFITLRREQGDEDVVQRQHVKSMYASNISAMPSDIEAQVNIDQMSDLLKFIKSR